MVRDFFSLMKNPLVFPFVMANKVNNMNSSLDDICNSAKDVGLTPANHLLGTSAVGPREFTPTVQYLGDTVVVGREDDVSKVIEMLLGPDMEDDKLSVISIVGMAGIGKTTLAKLVYTHEKVVSNFGGEQMWVCVSNNFKVERLLNEMFECLTGKKSELQNVGGIVKNLAERLNGKKYLLVLDDVWNISESEWECMRNSLLGIGGAKGSKIIVTTRDRVVVSTMQKISPTRTYCLLGLLFEDSLTLFMKKAFAEGGPRETESFLDIGRRMVKKCDGVPLAITVLGGLLWTKTYESEWESIEKSGILSSLGNENEILSLLRLSFNDLPSPSVKQCFAYCSIIPKDKVIIKDELIQLWTALGYLQPLSGTDWELEDVGSEYFNILWRKSLFQEVEWDEYDNITSCKMHDLVHDFALKVSEGKCLTLEASEVKDHPEVKHMRLCLGEPTRLEISKENVGKLRTLFLTGHLPINAKDVKSIRALSIVKSGVEVFPISISKFMHLKYLDLSKCCFEKVPGFITELYNLETLRLPNVKKFPKKFHKLVSLRHLCMGDNKVIPALIGDLTSLRTLTSFVIGKDKGQKIKELGRLSKLRGNLKIYNLELVRNREEAKTANMLQKTNIQELVYCWAEGDYEESQINHEEVLEGLQPHKNLKGLILEYFGGQRFASWMASRDAQLLQNLTKIKLKDCRLCKQVPTLGHLPHLAVVEMDGLHSLECIGLEFYGLDALAGEVVFPALRKLILENMPNLEVWSDVHAAVRSTMKFFPFIEKVSISECPQLMNIPVNLLSIQHIMITTPSYRKHFIFDGVERMYRSSLSILVKEDSEYLFILLEDLLEKSSKSLKCLRIAKLSKLYHLPIQLLNLTSLEKLEIAACDNLMSFFEDTDVSFFEDTEGAAFNRLLSLRQLRIYFCNRLRCLSKLLLRPTLDTLELDSCQGLAKTYPDELRNLTSLQNLTITYCPGLASCWGDGLFCLSSLRNLVIGGFSPELEHFPWPSTSVAVPDMPSTSTAVANIPLESLSLTDGINIQHLPDQLQHLTALRKLQIKVFTKLEALPEWLGNLSSLQSLKILYCPNLMSLPSSEAMQRLSNLQSLLVYGSPLLKERCESGTEGDKVTHIPVVRVEGLEVIGLALGGELMRDPATTLEPLGVPGPLEFLRNFTALEPQHLRRADHPSARYEFRQNPVAVIKVFSLFVKAIFEQLQGQFDEIGVEKTSTPEETLPEGLINTANKVKELNEKYRSLVIEGTAKLEELRKEELTGDYEELHRKLAAEHVSRIEQLAEIQASIMEQLHYAQSTWAEHCEEDISMFPMFLGLPGQDASMFREFLRIGNEMRDQLLGHILMRCVFLLFIDLFLCFCFLTCTDLFTLALVILHKIF